MKFIQLTKSNLFARVSDRDFKKVRHIKWYLNKQGRFNKTFYARAIIDGKFVYMHALISGNDITDHKDSDGLNNTRRNLRKCSQSQNCGNCRKTSRKTSSIFKGVFWHKIRKKWAAKVCKDYTVHHLGAFDNERVAALAYNRAAKRLFGQFARLNIL